MPPVDVSTVRHVHLIAICGTGMGSLAGMFKAKGLLVTGSDQAVYPPMSDQLAALGIPVATGYDPAHLEPRPDLVVIGNAISRGNPEGDAAMAMGIPYLSMAEALRLFFFQDKTLAALCGTHGKTTSTALLAWILSEAGRDPTYLVGGVLENTKASYRVGNGPLAVVEGDEYDTAWFDKVPKFVRYRPDLAVLGNIEFAHADIYPNIEAVIDAFMRVVTNLPPHGLLVAGIDSEHVCELLPLAPCPVLTVGSGPAAALTGHIVSLAPDRMRFEVIERGKPRGIYESRMVGEYNMLNILGVIGLTDRFGLTDAELRHGLETFIGVKRRQQVLGEVGDILLIDDFAHHPTAVRVTLSVLKAARPERRLVAVFEPRTNTSRRHFFQQVYPDSFSVADLVVVCEVQALHKGVPSDKLDVEKLIADLRGNGINALSVRHYDEIPELLARELRAGDQVVFLSNGGFGNVQQRTLEILKDRP